MLQVLLACSSSTPKLTLCQKYDWDKIVYLVEPYMDENMHTALIMQGQSSDYNTAQAAYQALGSVDNKEIEAILEQVIKANCSYINQTN